MTPHEYREACSYEGAQADHWYAERERRRTATADFCRALPEDGDVPEAARAEALRLYEAEEYADGRYRHHVNALRELRRRARDGEL